MKPAQPGPKQDRRAQTRRAGSDLLTLGVIFGLVAAVYLLPPDRSLAEVEGAGRLRVCVPDSYPPLVTGDPARPGIDIELLRAIAERLGVTLTLNTNSAMGRDFNPRNWRVNRAQCMVLAGGVVATQTTRSFLETTDPHLETGWAMVSTGANPELAGATVGVYPGLTGLDRIALSRTLRGAGATIKLLNGRAAVEAALASGEIGIAVTEGVLAQDIATARGWTMTWMPPPLGRSPIALGLWKGDLTLKREIAGVMADLRSDGTLDEILARYGIGGATPGTEARLAK